MTIIEAENLRKTFKKFEAVKGISFQVNAGEIFGFLGPNGAGKSTTIKMLTTLLKPTSGRARLAGYDTLTKKHQVRQAIGLVFQDQTLDERLTARENLLFHSMLYAIPKEERKRRMHEVLQMVELEKKADDLVKTFSGGMKRRLEIARGLIHYPKVLFLDEPTVGLDPQTRSHIWEYIHRVKKEHGITIFLTTHYMDEAENCERIAVIDYGKIVALDTPKNLKDNLGGDTIRFSTSDLKTAAEIVQKKFNLKVLKQEDSLLLTVAHGEKFIPRLINTLPMEVTSITLHKPTLDDVFLHLTGREIRKDTSQRIRPPHMMRH